MTLRSLPSIIVVLAAIQAGLAPAASAPLDFSYRVTGLSEVKPLIVFNDGVDTFIQPQELSDKTLRINGGQPTRQGPYFVVRGMPAEITLSQEKKASVVITYSKQPAKVVTPRIEDQSSLTPQGRPGPQVEYGPGGKARTPPAATPVAAKPSVQCKPHKEQRDTALVAAFKANAATLSDAAKNQIADFLSNAAEITHVEIITEADAKGLQSKRGDTIRKIAVDASVARDKIDIVPRASTGIGSEIHVHRAVEVPCDANLVKVPSKKAPVTIVWDGDAKALLERVASELRVRFSVEGSVTEVPVHMALTDEPFNEAMVQIGRAIDADADLVLRSDELVLKFKGLASK